jgi:hypothetical protein
MCMTEEKHRQVIHAFTASNSAAIMRINIVRDNEPYGNKNYTDADLAPRVTFTHIRGEWHRHRRLGRGKSKKQNLTCSETIST